MIMRYPVPNDFCDLGLACSENSEIHWHQRTTSPTEFQMNMDSSLLLIVATASILRCLKVAVSALAGILTLACDSPKLRPA
jgi:hypothetical protein